MTVLCRSSVLSIIAFVGISPHAADAQEFLRSNPKFMQPFREVVQPHTASVVRVQCDGKDTCLGTIVDAGGWILTKAHDLHGKIVCKLSDGSEWESLRFGSDEGNDLTLLRINAKQLKAIRFADSKSTRAGSWVASVGPGQDPIAVGVVSVPTRKVVEAYLGIGVEESSDGLTVLNIAQQSPALKAGVRPKEIILTLDGHKFTNLEQFLQRLASCRPGETITLSIRRGRMEQELKVTLQSRERAGDFRQEFQNRLGSELSNRRSGYSIILQHDSVVRPNDCGGPLVDLNGRVIGINISRAGRTESWAIPAEAAQPLIAELKRTR